MTYYEALKMHLEALDAHDRETRRMHQEVFASNEYPPAGTFPAREEKRRLLSVRLEEAARGVVSVHFGVEVMP
jgi:hypothetical protein